MNEKFLPVGTVCTTKINNRKLLIIGYLPTKYNGNISFFDYQGCIYPEGTLGGSGFINFNHDDILSVDFLGYSAEEYQKLNSSLYGSVTKNDNQEASVSNFMFDENGVVIFDGSQKEQSVEIFPEVEVNNPFKMEYSPNTENINNDISSINSGFKFDENGVIIEDGSATEEVTAEDMPKVANYAFGADGTVLSDSLTPPVETTDGYTFDANGIVTAQASTSTPEYKFDENGVIVSDSSKDDLTPKYQFDSNGTIISE